MKIKTIEEAKINYVVEYELPDEFVKEFERIKSEGNMEEMEKFLSDVAEVTRSEQQTGEGYDFVISELEVINEPDPDALPLLLTTKQANKMYGEFIKETRSDISLEEWLKTHNRTVDDLIAFVSLDVESDGLWGNPFAIGVACYNVNKEEIHSLTWVMKDLDKVVTNPWVKDNVLPNMDMTSPLGGFVTDNYNDNRVTRPVRFECDLYEEMLWSFANNFWNYVKDAQVIWHMGHVVEANLFKELRNHEFIGDFDAPYTPIELSVVLASKGCNPDSVDKYIEEQLHLMPVGNTHDPLYDARAAAVVFFD